MKKGQVAIRSDYRQARICHFIKGEEAQQRHRRRYEMAMDGIPIVQPWCDHRGVFFQVKDIHGHPKFKWKFRFPDRFAVWLPWAGKFSCKRSLHGEYHVIKVYDWEQLLKALEWWLA